MTKLEFPQSVIERLGYYVYTLADPTDGKVFYVGKGTGNRVFSHVNAKLIDSQESDKLNKIRETIASGGNVRFKIIRHGLLESEAYEVESALIDYIGLDQLTNIKQGIDIERRGRMSVAEIIATYDAKPVTITEPVLLIIVNKLFERNISPERLYEITRGNWVLGERRNKARYGFCVYRGIIREVYKITSWSMVEPSFSHTKHPWHWRFTGEVSVELHEEYVGGSVEKYLKLRAQNPVRYVNC